jgi:hypothetical protein
MQEPLKGSVTSLSLTPSTMSFYEKESRIADEKLAEEQKRKLRRKRGLNS